MRQITPVDLFLCASGSLPVCLLRQCIKSVTLLMLAVNNLRLGAQKMANYCKKMICFAIIIVAAGDLTAGMLVQRNMCGGIAVLGKAGSSCSPQPAKVTSRDKSIKHRDTSHGTVQ